VGSDPDEWDNGGLGSSGNLVPAYGVDGGKCREGGLRHGRCRGCLRVGGVEGGVTATAALKAAAVRGERRGRAARERKP
jgi:hypothetical protein